MTASTVNSNFDAFGRAQTTTYLDGSTVNRVYGCCGVESETDRDGITTTYAYDDFKRLSYSMRDGITTLYSYNAAGNQTSVTVKGRNTTEITTSTEYVNGEVSATVDALNNRTTYARQYAISGETTTYTETVTNPDNSTRVTTSVNGEQTGVSGTAVHGQTFTYGANWQMTTTPIVSGANMTVKSYTDLLGRNFETEYADSSYSMNYYNAQNQLVKSVAPSGVTTLYTYDALGRQTTQAIDMNTNDAIDSADIVTSTTYGYATYSGKTVSVTTTTRSQGNDSAVVSIARQSVDGLESWSTDMAGLTTHTLLERLGSGATRQTVTNPDGTKTITNMTNGKVTSVQQVNSDDSLGNLNTYSYDEFNRVIGMTETNDQTTVNTTARTYNANDAVLTQTVNGQITSYVYDSMGRQTQVTAPGNVVSNYTYFPTGEPQRIDGATYPLEYTYNGLGQQATMTTFKDTNTPQVTSWAYNNRGFMIAKTYADNNGPTYTYNADGQLLTRTWSRGITTTYAYDAAGRQTGYSYSDGVTPSVSLALNYLDQTTTITDAAGTRNFTYNVNYRLANETNPVIVNGVMNYTYDAYGRRTGMNLTDGTVRAQAGYSYDTAGRVATVGDGGDTLTYAYAPGTSRIASTTWENATVNTAYTYDSYKRLTGIAVNNQSVYGYTLNDKDQRTAATLENGDNWAYTYDTQGQLTGALKKDSQDNTLNNMSYAFDLIGNRTTATEDAANWTYASNLLNQYTQVNALAPTYDADGNMLTWNGWTYTWNGENRLVCAESDDTKVEMSYDYMGRRFEKKVYTKGLLNLYTWTLQKHRKFAYDGYKLIAEFDAMNNDALLANYLWQPVGLDVPLRATIDGDACYFIADGNKNIIALKDATGATTDDYTYTPFGAVTTSGATDNPFRFSSEYHDTESDLVYYNYRYYNPTLGRWTKRDPIGEDGGSNLYGFINNDTLNDNDQGGYFGNGRTYYKYNRNLFNDGTKLSVSVQWDWAFITFTRNATDAEIAAAVFPGHSDFSRGYPEGVINGEDWFDFTREDEDWATSPWPLIGKPENHFQELNKSYKDIMNAIGIKWRKNKAKNVEPRNFARDGLQCHKNEFQHAMHRAQDFYSHRQKGFYYDPSKVIQFIRNRDLNRNSDLTVKFDWFAFGHLFAGTKPDNDTVAWGKAETETIQWLKVWDCFCGGPKK